MIVGPANCAKTFLLSPLDKVFHTFCNPATYKYARIGADNAEAMFLNDFRWSPELIASKDLLLLLSVKLPSPKNQYATDVCINNDVPVFTYTGKYNISDEVENEKLVVKWKLFKFHHKIAQKDQKSVPSCARCFSELVFLGRI